MLRVKTNILQSDTTRRMTYLIINPKLMPYQSMKNINMKEQDRLALTRLRLSSHHLKVETGRWARIPRERRVCPCQEGMIQDEHHVFLHCAKSQPLREQYYNVLTFTELSELVNCDQSLKMAEYCRKVLELYRT